jgi:Flp pilus assembly pilin Flp
MHRFVQDTGQTSGWPRSQTPRSTDGTNVVEYGLLALLLITVVGTGVTLFEGKLNGVYGAVANTMEQSGGTESVVPTAQDRAAKARL